MPEPQPQAEQQPEPAELATVDEAEAVDQADAADVALDLGEDHLAELPHTPFVVESAGAEFAPAPLEATADDPELATAIGIAEAALAEITDAERIGEYVGIVDEGDGAYSLQFATGSPGHRDWRWTVSLVRLADESAPSVLECELLPSESSLLAPAWVPWAERLAEFRATHDRHGNLLPDEDTEESESEGEPAAPRESTRTTGRTRTRRRHRRDRERGGADAEQRDDENADAEQPTEPQSSEPAAKRAERDEAAAETPTTDVDDSTADAADDGTAERPKKSKKRDKPEKSKKSGKGDKKKDRKGGKREKQRHRLPATEVAVDGTLPVAPDIREYADDMDDVLDGVEFEDGDAASREH